MLEGLPPAQGSDATETQYENAGRLGGKLGRFLLSSEFGLLLLVVLAFAGFWLSTRGFSSPFNQFGLSRSAAVNILISLSMMSVIVSGGLDLSIGAIGVCASILAGWLMEACRWPAPASVAVGLALGGLLGFANGQIIVRTGMHSFVVTLATMSVFFGGMIILTTAKPFDSLPDDFSLPAQQHLFGAVSPLLVYSVLIACMMAYLYRLTAIGRDMLAVGANARAALLSGISASRAVTLCHAMAGILAAVAGVMLSMRNGAAIPSMAGNLGQDWLLPAFLGPVLGGASLSGGRVSVLGAVLGAVLISVINNGLLLLHVGAFWLQFFLGMLLLGAVMIDKARMRVFASGDRR
ncbi:ABC transporter permease [Methylocapsa sp. S129]|uniref:ABC transporter permease n=1 Tax=Methylocapsa sp. S129 TaxID=1641869 RepID=UPI00131AAF5B|nr:ABC transporter permease [Methylocapsa sp. S129]